MYMYISWYIKRFRHWEESNVDYTVSYFYSVFYTVVLGPLEISAEKSVHRVAPGSLR